MNDIRVSAVIPCYNYGRFLGEAIESVLAQTVPAHEIIVVDDGSTDDTPEVARSFGDKVRYVRTPNGGVSAARNAGIALAEGGLIAFLDADDRWLPQKLERQVPVMAADPTIGLLHAGSRVFNGENGQTLCSPLPSQRMSIHDLMNCCAISLPSTIVPRRVFSAVGGFDEAHSSTEDWEMWLRIAAKYQVVGCREILVEYREHHESLSRGNALGHFRGCMAVLTKAGKIHRHCKPCENAIRSARQRLGLELYSKLSAEARDCFRRGQFLDGCKRRIMSVWNYPQIILAARQILRRRLAKKAPPPCETVFE